MLVSLPHTLSSVSLASTCRSPRLGLSTGITCLRSRTPCSTSFIVKGLSVRARLDHRPSNARLTVLLCISVIQRPSGVSGGSNRHSGHSVRAVSQSLYRIPSQPANRKAKAWAAQRCHSGVVPFNWAGG